MSSFIRRFSTKEDVEKAEKNKLRTKGSADSGGDASKANDFDLLLRSGETILLSMSPGTSTGAAQRTPVRVGNAGSSATATTTTTTAVMSSSAPPRDSLETAMEKITRPDPHYRDLQRANKPNTASTGSLVSGHRRVMSTESISSAADSVEETATISDLQNDYLRQENMRLEKRIQELNSELFKERTANADLSSEVKEALSALEKLQKQEANATTGPNISPASTIFTSSTGSSSVAMSPMSSSSPVLARASILPASSGDKAIASFQTSMPSPITSATSDGEWQKRYQELETRSNALSAKAVQTIQESKLKLTALQRENLELKDQVRDLQTHLQEHAIEKGRAMSLIPRLVEMVQKLQKEIAEEKQKRKMENEFDDLTKLVQQRPTAASSSS